MSPARDIPAPGDGANERSVSPGNAREQVVDVLSRMGSDSGSHRRRTISLDVTRPTTSRTRPRPSAPLAVAFVPGQHRHTYINPCPAACITFAIAFALGTRFWRSRHDGPPLGLEKFFDQWQPLAFPRPAVAEAASAFQVDVPAGGVPFAGEEPPGTTLPFPTGGTFTPQAEQFLAIEDGTCGAVRPRITHVTFSLSGMRPPLDADHGAT